MVRGMQWQALRPLLRRAKGLVAVCHFEVEVFARRLGLEPERIRLIRNGAEPLPVGDSCRPKVSGSPLVCSVARLERYKGHHRLIAAMPALLDLAPDAHLAVIGRGSFEHAAPSPGRPVAGRTAVTFTSFDATQREALGALLRSSDVVALMSDYEANPVAVMEALALGRKVVVADTSGLSELASEGLATVGAAERCPLTCSAGVLARVAARPDPVAPDLPTWDDCADQLLGLYGEILSSAPERLRQTARWRTGAAPRRWNRRDRWRHEFGLRRSRTHL